MSEKVLMSWSGGKDSAIALHELKSLNDFEITSLLTTITEDYDRISMHGIQRQLLERQADSLGLAVEKIYITKKSSDQDYDARMKDALLDHQRQGVSSVAFGDIFLEDLRRYREDNLSKIGMKGVFPIWKRNTTELARQFIELGFKAVIACVDSKSLSGDFVGRAFDDDFLTKLPHNIDPCGENGEFHSFVYDGPIFREPIRHKVGKPHLRDNRFYYCDILP